MNNPLPFDDDLNRLDFETQMSIDKALFTIEWNRMMIELWIKAAKRKKPWWRFW